MKVNNGNSRLRFYLVNPIGKLRYISGEALNSILKPFSEIYSSTHDWINKSKAGCIHNFVKQLCLQLMCLCLGPTDINFNKDNCKNRYGPDVYLALFFKLL